MGGKSQPNYQQLAMQQGEADREVIRDQTYANRADQVTPWGAIGWETYEGTDPATGESITRWKQTQSLDPRLQDMLNKQIAIQGGRTDLAGYLTGRLGSEYSQGIDWSGLGPMGGVPPEALTMPKHTQAALNVEDAPQIQGPTQQGGISTENLPSVGIDQQQTLDYGQAPEVADPYQTRASAENAVYQQAMSRIEPQFDGQKQQAEIQMRNQGLRPGDAAWEARMGQINQQQTDARNQALWSASAAGRDEAGQMFGQQMDRRNMATSEADRMGQFYNQANQNLFGMQSGLRDQLFGERTTQGQFANDALRNLFDMQSQNRNQYVAERGTLADFYNRAQQQAYNQDFQSNQANFDQQMRASQYANAIRAQQIEEAMARRSYGLNEINALLQGQQVQTPQFNNYAGAGAAQAAPIYQAGVDQGNYNAASSPWAGLMDLGGTLGGAAINKWG